MALPTTQFPKEKVRADARRIEREKGDIPPYLNKVGCPPSPFFPFSLHPPGSIRGFHLLYPTVDNVGIIGGLDAAFRVIICRRIKKITPHSVTAGRKIAVYKNPCSL